MSSRRIEKIDRVIRAAVSEIIRDRLSDPRIRGLVTVTRVETAPDLKSTAVFVSVMGVPPVQERLTLAAIEHAHPFIQAQLADVLTTKTCPTLHFHRDDTFKEQMRTLEILEKLSAQREAEGRIGGGETEPGPVAEGAAPEDER
jgi:ribosome-binding factor A